MSIKSHNTFKEINLEQKIGAIAKQETTNIYIIQLNANIFFKQNEQDLFFIKAIIIGAIEVGKDFEEKSLNNMVAIMFSYLRPMVAQMTVMAKLPPLDLQPVNFEEFEVKVEKSANKK